MCGRATLTTPPEDLAEIFGLAEVPALAPRFNIAPTQPIAIVRATKPAEPPARRLELVHWGLVPHWAADARDAARHINARAETLFTKPAFRDAARDRRCLVVVDGFFEWKADPARRGKKEPFWIRRPDGKPFALAGVWDAWTSRAPGPPVALETCAVVTIAPTPAIARIHDRMPLVLEPDAYAAWLDPRATSREAIAHLLDAPVRTELVAVPVSTRVNDVKNDDPSCIAPAEQGTLFRP
jgi:putative SOS response-associated peptidase YedK